MRLCVFAGKSGQSDCVYGAVRDITSQAASGTPAATFCRKVSDGLRAKCFEGMGTIIATLETEEQAIRTKCAALSGTYRNDCIRGAGLTTAS